MSPSKFVSPLILPHSDLHLDKGKFTFPDVQILESQKIRPCIAVFAGDIEAKDNFASALRNMYAGDIVATAGNHDFWDYDYFERLEYLKSSSKDHNIHFLENSSVVLHGVRFIGATLWTDYCGGDPSLMHYGLWYMRDHMYIKAPKWWTSANKKKFLSTFGQHALEKFEGNFNPLLQMELHAKTKKFLIKMSKETFHGHTVLVTHHAPTQNSLLKAGIKDYALDSRRWRVSRDDDLNLSKVGSYASRLLDKPSHHDDCKKFKSDRFHIGELGLTTCIHGHLHQAMDYGLNGVRVICNPRGRVIQPLTSESARAYAFFGYCVSEADIKKSQNEYAANPERGDGWNYDKNKIVDLEESRYHWIQDHHEQLIEKIQVVENELQGLVSLSKSKKEAVANLAAMRCDVLRQRVIEAVKEFLTDMLSQMERYNSHDALNWMMSSAKLCKFNDHILSENFADFETSKRFSVPEGFSGYNLTPARHVQSFKQDLKRMKKYLTKVPSACDKLAHEFFKLMGV